MASLLIVEDNFELATLLEAAAEARGHVVQLTHTGKAALSSAASTVPELAIVDLLLPDISGGTLLDQLRALGIRTIAMSGVYKGSRFAKEARERHGAVAFFEKPFPLNELMQVVESFAGPAPVATLPRQDDEQPLEVVVVTPPTPEPADLLPLEEWERIWRREAPTLKKAESPSLPRSGSLTQSSVPRLLNAFYQARHTGELVLHRPPAIKVLSFEAGQPVYAASNLAHERFARFCARKGLLPQGDLDAVAQLAREEGVRTGVAMVRLDVITEAQRVALLEEQIREIVWSTFSWTEGAYSFTRGKVLRPDVVRLSLFTGELILNGLMREPLVPLRQRMGVARMLQPTADPPYGLEQFNFSYGQAVLVASADGTKNVGDLLALTDLPEGEALGFLVGLEQLGFVEEKKVTANNRHVSFGF